MTLYDMLDNTIYDQKVWVYANNAYDQNMLLFKGTVNDARRDEDVWVYLMHDVEVYYYVAGKLIILVRNQDYEERLEKQYSCSDKWGRDKKDRPWRWTQEIDEEAEEDGQ